MLYADDDVREVPVPPEGAALGFNITNQLILHIGDLAMGDRASWVAESLNDFHNADYLAAGNAGHYLPLEVPGLFKAAVLSWLHK